MNRTSAAAVTAALGVVLAGPAGAQPGGPDPVVLRGQSDQTYTRLAEAERKLLAGKPADAADDVQRILDEAGDDLVAADKVHYRPARRVAHQVLAKLPPAVLRAYRDRVDEPAARLLAAGRAARDPRPLQALLDRYFAGRPAEDALLLLGELAFERGDFRAAEGHWRRLLPGGDPADPPFPDPATDPAAVRARVALALIFQRELARAEQEVVRLKADSPTAGGRLAGRDGPFADTLRALLDRPPVLPPDQPGGGDWPTFGGSPARNGRASAEGLLHQWPRRPTWVAPIPGDGPGPRPRLPRVGAGRGPGFHPVVLDGVAYLADATRVWGFDLRTGAARFTYGRRAAGRPTGRGGRPGDPPAADGAFTLTAAGGRLYARVGDPAVAPPDADPLAPAAGPATALVCFAPPADPVPGGPPLEVRWRVPPPVPDGAAAVWEGAPVVAGGRVYAAFARFDGTRMAHAMACFDDHDPPGKPAWVADVCDGPAPGPADARARPEPVTLAGGNVVFCSHTGVVAAVDARTGKPAWALKYPKAHRPPAVPARDLAPPVADGGRVFVAPADADRVFALDAETGRELWRTETPIQVRQLLGVARGRLVVTVEHPVRGIRGLDVATGSDREPAGWRNHDAPLRPFGRGLVSDDLVVWATEAGGVRLSPEYGDQPRPPLKGPDGGPLGNLALADGVLLVATATELWGYVPHQPPADPAGPAVARAERLAAEAERALAAGRPDDARGLLRQGLADGFPPAWRARAAGRLVTLEPPGGGPPAAARFLAGLGPAGELAAGWVVGPAGVPTRVRDLAARHFDATPPASPEPARRPDPAPGPAFDPAALHRLDAGAMVAHETAFPSVCRPLLPFAGAAGLPGLGPEAGGEPRLLVTDGAAVLAYRPRADRPAWRAPLPAGLAVTHAAVVDGAVVAAGPGGAARLGLADGRVGWTFALPDADPVPARGPQPLPPGAGAGRPALTGFALAGPRLVARAGDHHLLALDVGTGAVAWVLDGVGRPRFSRYPIEAGPRFAGPVYADPAVVLAHLSTGVRWAVDPASGAVTAFPSAPVPWDGPPARLPGGRVAVADGPGLVRVVDPDADRAGWAAEVEGEASLSGRPPQVRPVPDGLVVAVARNHGVELYRFRPDRGVGERRVPHLLAAGAVDLGAADSDAAAVYVPADGRLTAVGLAGWNRLWDADLAAEVPGAAGWRVVAGRLAVVAVPTEPVPVDPPAEVLSRAARAFARRPDVCRVPGLAAGLYDAWAARVVPVLVLDPDTGRIRRRLDLPAAGPAVGVHLGPTHAVVVTAGRASWLQSP